MIKPHCHTREWIEAQRDALGGADALILERAIMALTLLTALSRTSLKFVFKGGTSLLLHLPQPLRLSIDIDIVAATNREELAPLLDSLVGNSPFLRWEEHVRGEARLPKRLHFKLFFKSALPPGGELPVLLDVVTEENRIADLVDKPVQVSFIESDELVTVKTPTTNALLGDKLTAFAPNTIGVPLTEHYSQQVIKQLFDAAQLYDRVTVWSEVARANQTSFEAEKTYRGLGFAASYDDYLDDVTETCRQLGAIDLKGYTETDATRLMKRGVGQLATHLAGCRFKLPEAKIAAAKVAVLASHLRQPPSHLALPRFAPGNIMALRDHQLCKELSSLHRLKGSLPEAYFYWANCRSE